MVSVAQGTKPIFTTDHLSLLRAEGSKSKPALIRIITKANFLQMFRISYPTNCIVVNQTLIVL